MLKKTITYKNFDDKEVTKDFYFNLTQAELTEFQLDVASAGKDFEKLQELADENGKVSPEELIKTQNHKAIVNFFKEIVKKSYGVRTPDGDFDKSELLSERFIHSEAYSVLFMDILSNEEEAAAFVIGVMPSETRPKLTEYLAKTAPSNK